MVVVDSDVWVHYLRSPDSPTGFALQALLDANQVLMVGVVLAEVLQGSRNEDEYRAILPLLDAVPYMEATKDTWAVAGHMSTLLRRRGNTTPLSDLTVAALALEGGHEVFSLNGHFERVPDLKLYSPPS